MHELAACTLVPAGLHLLPHSHSRASTQDSGAGQWATTAAILLVQLGYGQSSSHPSMTAAYLAKLQDWLPAKYVHINGKLVAALHAP
jgi:hypothetical protein